MDWEGDNPLYMVVQTLTDIAAIDLDEPGWQQTYASMLADPGFRMLVRKDNDESVLERFCHEGEAIAYNSRVIGYFGGPQVRAYGFKIIGEEGASSCVYWAPWVDKVFESERDLMSSAAAQLASLGRRASDIVVPDE